MTALGRIGRIFRRDYWKWRLFNLRQRYELRVNRGFDVRYGTDTASEAIIREMGVSAEAADGGNNVYRPVWEHEFRSFLAMLPLSKARFTFIDVGSGKGKLCFVASFAEFEKVIGIEYAPGLHEIALRNLAAFRASSGVMKSISLINGDALLYDLPEGALVCYIFNAFAPEIMQRVIERFDAACARPEPVLITYANLRTVHEVPDEIYAGLRNLSVVKRSRTMLVLANPAGAALMR